MTRTVSRAEWLAARLALLEEEKALTQARAALAAKRRALPWTAVDAVYRFGDGPDQTDLPGLFGPYRQLVVMHFMFGADWKAGCPSCSFWADGYDGLTAHLAARDTGFVAVSTADVERIAAYRARMGWRFRWVSGPTAFGRDFGVHFPEPGAVHYNYRDTTFPMTEAPGLSVFYRPDPDVPDQIVHTYSTYARGLDPMNAAYQLLDLTPLGRDEGDLPYPMAWIRHHDEYA